MKIFGIAGHSGMGKPTLWPDWPGIMALASDTPLAVAEQTGKSSLVQLDLSDTASLAVFVLVRG